MGRLCPALKASALLPDCGSIQYPSAQASSSQSSPDPFQALWSASSQRTYYSWYWARSTLKCNTLEIQTLKRSCSGSCGWTGLTQLYSLGWKDGDGCSDLSAVGRSFVSHPFRCWELPPSTAGLIKAWSRDLLCGTTDANFCRAEFRKFCTLHCRAQFAPSGDTNNCPVQWEDQSVGGEGMDSSWEERWTNCLIVAACLFLKTSCLMLSLGIHSHKDWCHGNTNQHFVEQLENFTYEGESSVLSQIYCVLIVLEKTHSFFVIILQNEKK